MHRSLKGGYMGSNPVEDANFFNKLLNYRFWRTTGYLTVNCWMTPRWALRFSSDMTSIESSLPKTRGWLATNVDVFYRVAIYRAVAPFEWTMNNVGEAACTTATS